VWFPTRGGDRQTAYKKRGVTTNPTRKKERVWCVWVVPCRKATFPKMPVLGEKGFGGGMDNPFQWIHKRKKPLGKSPSGKREATRRTNTTDRKTWEKAQELKGSKEKSEGKKKKKNAKNGKEG